MIGHGGPWVNLEPSLSSRVNLTFSLCSCAVTDDQNFKDGQFLYRFTADDQHEGGKEREKEKERRQTVVGREFINTETFHCKMITVSQLAPSTHISS